MTDPPSPTAAPDRAGAVRRLHRPRALLARHWPLLVIVLGGMSLRLLALIAVRPGIWFPDSNGFIRGAATGELSTTRVDGYALFVAPFWHAGSALALIAAQHVLGLVISVALYVLLVRRGVRRPLAALGAAPAALDAYLVTVEHTVMSETVYHAVVVAALLLLLWDERPSPATVIFAGALLGYAGIVRSVAMPLVVIALVYLLLRRVGWRRVVLFTAGWAIVAGGYASLFAVQHGEFGFTSSGDRFLYARVAPFADCERIGDVRPDLVPLCPDPAAELTTNELLWGRHSPIAGRRYQDPRIGEFSGLVIRQRPLEYARTITAGVLHYFEPGHRIGANDYPVGPWRFPADPRVRVYRGYRGPIRAGAAPGERRRTTRPNRYVSGFANGPAFGPAASRLLHDYQRAGYAWGPLLAACVLLVVAALVTRRGPPRLRLDAALLAATVLSCLTVSQAFSVFSYRYGFIAAVLLPPAGALAWTALRTRPGQPPADSSAAADERPVRTAPSI